MYQLLLTTILMTTVRSLPHYPASEFDNDGMEENFSLHRAYRDTVHGKEILNIMSIAISAY